MALTKNERRTRIKYRIRKIVSGNNLRPRMSVFRSNKQIYVQLIDDISGVTIVSASSKVKEIAEKKGINKIQQAQEVGKLIAKIAIERGIKEVAFDRGGYLYHGRIKSLAEAARKEGLKI